MIICHSRKFILFNNPGTGTGPLLRLLAPWGEEPVVEYRQRSPDLPFHHLMTPAEAAWLFDARGLPFHDYRRITLVANPFTRLQALYRRIADTDPNWAVRRQTPQGQPDFCVWVRGTRPAGRGAGGPPHLLWRRYGTWSAEAWCGNLIADPVRAEDMGHALPRLFAELRIDPGPVPPPVAEPGHAWNAVLDGPTALLVARRYASDLARFGWSHPVLDWAA